ncbi:ATP-binding protein [Methylobacterium sp. J-070]|uniref:ATP-binding protein n=1 Tax=Methylobacterium sp. J-070 TaxID=2836650 RepID=UPI001FBA9BAC|nr:ATP-binding protein [Methylobacterium sp. J-070]MCJ2052828.1 ATP-binding protein [Methylobacterium sp. J-070]
MFQFCSVGFVERAHAGLGRHGRAADTYSHPGRCCARRLPAALVAAADLRIYVGPPTAKALRAAIGLATGRSVGRLPDDVVLGLGLDEIASCIRKGSAPRDCVRRLRTASASKRSGAEDLADVPFLEDAHGYSGGAMEHGLALIEAMKAYRRREKSFSSIERKHIVLSGNPGTSKTTYARSLAKSLGLHLSVTSVSSWFAQTGDYLNEICKKIDEVFQEASQLGGILLFYEIDCLPSRENSDVRFREYWSAVTAHVLTLLDGAVFSPASRLIIIGATNYPARLDPALTRPGRLDRLVHINLPDEVAIEGHPASAPRRGPRWP